MKIIIAPRARRELGNQLGYLVDQGSIASARRLERRISTFLADTLSRHPRFGNFIAERDIWETWIPGTRIVIWYRFTDEELQVVRVWHTSQNRPQGT